MVHLADIAYDIPTSWSWLFILCSGMFIYQLWRSTWLIYFCQLWNLYRFGNSGKFPVSALYSMWPSRQFRAWLVEYFVILSDLCASAGTGPTDRTMRNLASYSRIYSMRITCRWQQMLSRRPRCVFCIVSFIRSTATLFRKNAAIQIQSNKTHPQTHARTRTHIE